MCAPDGRITYVSLVDSGTTNDATAWNTALKFLPIDLATGEERGDGATLIDDLEEFYGVGDTETSELNGDEHYPGILELTNCFSYILWKVMI